MKINERLTAGHLRAGLFTTVTVLNLLIVVSGVYSRWFPPNDSRHWLLRARYYAGMPMPASETVGQFATHPVSIMSLSLLLLLLGSAILAAKVWTILAYLWATTSIYVAARELFPPWIAILAFAIGSFGQYLYFDLLSFGGIPQLISVGFFTLSIAAMVRARKTGLPEDRFAFAIILCLGYFSHPPSSPTYVFAIGGATIALAARTSRLRIIAETVIDAILPSIIFLVYLASQWDIFSLYVSSAGGNSFNDLLFMLGRSPLYSASAIGLIAVYPFIVYLLRIDVNLRETFDPTPDRHSASLSRTHLQNQQLFQLKAHQSAFLVLGWVVGPFAFAGFVSMTPAIQTEVARLAYFLIPPVTIAAALYLGLLSRLSAGLVERYGLGFEAGIINSQRVVSLLVVITVLTPAIVWSTAYYDSARDYYSVKNEESVRAVVEWIETSEPIEGRVAGPYYMIPWVEALTGQPGFTKTPTSGSYRPDERPEAAAYQELEKLRWEGASEANLADAREVIHRYDVHYIIVPNNWRKSRFSALGDEVFSTDAIAIIEIDPAIWQGENPPNSGGRGN